LKILGVDPGVSNCGWALVRPSPLEVLACGSIGVPLKTDPERISAYFGQQWGALLGGVDRVGSEALTWFSMSQERAKARGHAQTMPTETMVKLTIAYTELLGACRDREIPFRKIQPPALKAAVTGHRKASKQPMLDAVRDLFPGWTGSHHTADAVLAALACWAPEALLGERVTAQ